MQKHRRTASRHAPGTPDPLRRWHSFHTKDRGRYATTTEASPASAAAATSAEAAKPPPGRFLSPPPLGNAPRRRFSVCFGKRSGVSVRRPNECLILEPSEMLVVDYPDAQSSRNPRTHGAAYLQTFPHGHLNMNEQFRGDMHPLMGPGPRNEVYVSVMGTQSHRSSRGSDTSSAYSGSDTMHSVPSSDQDNEGTSVDPDADCEEVDLTGLMESIVDSDEEEDLAESIDSLTVRDTVRECLEKDPSDRTEDDIDILLEFTQHLRAFSNMTLSVRRALCRVMVFAVVEKAGTIVMNDGEELDSWSVIINGHVEVDAGTGELQTLHLGDSFGITPTMEKLYHKGVMRTKCDDCQFVCITQNDYYRILHQGEENTRKHEENGRIVLVTEQRAQAGASVRSHIVIKGTVERLMAHLLEDSLGDPTYVEDFLLTHRIFIDSPLIVCAKLLESFNDASIRDKVTRVVLLWVHNHFTDFETDPSMMEFLETFETLLEQTKMQEQVLMLNVTCAAKARSRTVTLTRPSREEVLHFSILGGYERGFGVFIAKVEKGSKAEEVGLKRGDQILEVNGQSFEHISHSKALDVLRGSTHLSITVRSNLLAFKKMLNTPEGSPRPRSRKPLSLPQETRNRLGSASDHADGASISSGGSSASGTSSPCKDKSSGSHKGFMTIGHKANKLKDFMKKYKIMPRGNAGESCTDDAGYSQLAGPSTLGPDTLYHSHSNPDLTSYCYEDTRADFPEHVLKVYKADQTCKYLLIHKETTAREVVMLALQEFNITDASSNYSLCEVTVTDSGIIKQRRLPDQLQNLAERIGIASRYYLKNNQSTETLVPDDLAGELMRESQVHFLQLNAVEVAVQLTLQDFAIFTQIESTEYVDDLFSLKSKYGTPRLSQFSELVNREMFWVVTEVCTETNAVRRMRVIKQFIKVARHCKECKNFNSMFAIISGLGHGAVSRLKSSWEKLPGKYLRLFKDMQDLMDPSRNMSKYRNLINSEHVRPPMIPFFPVVKKDLTFIHLGNDTRVDGLINFEKLRMIAKEVKSLSHMCSAPYDLFTMMELGGQPPSEAMMAMNQLTTGSGMAGGIVQHGHHFTATVKRRKKSTVMPQPKKMFEEAQMVRRVKAYLANMKVLTDEDQLRQLSLEVEPPAGGAQASSSSSSGGGGGGSESRATGSAVLSAVQIRKRQPSPTLSTTSTTSSTSATSEGRKSQQQAAKFGGASPQSFRKLMALSEPSKTRPYQPPRAPHLSSHSTLPLGLPLPLAHSPSPSPGLHRRGAPAVQSSRAGHERSHSDAASLPVDLSAESSSVCSLTNMPLRKNHMSGSVTSSDSGSVSSLPHPLGIGLTLGIGLGIGLGAEVDQGYCTQLDSHSNSSSDVAPPPVGRAPLPTDQSPQVAPRTRANYPAYVHGNQALAWNSARLSSVVQMLPHLPMASLRGQYPLPPRGRRPPDYNLATQMARMARLSRAHSHEGVTSYFHSDPEEDDDDEDDDAQVSAV